MIRRGVIAVQELLSATIMSMSLAQASNEAAARESAAALKRVTELEDELNRTTEQLHAYKVRGEKGMGA